MFLQNGRWRGTMPFRTDKVSRNLFESKGRTGESSLASIGWIFEAYKYIGKMQERGRGKSEGSFTNRMNEAFSDWKRVKVLVTLTH